MFNNKSKIYEDNITEDELNEYFDMYHKYETVGDIESGTYILIIDREKFYFYKGHIVPEWLYKATADDLKIKDYRKCKNDTEKVVFIDKFGYKNFIKFGIVVDSYENYPENEMWFKSEYQLVDMSSLPMFCAEENEYYLEPKIRMVSKCNYAPFLYMKNQTTGEYHLEGVHPSCKTLYDAIKMRYNDLNIQDFEIKDIR